MRVTIYTGKEFDSIDAAEKYLKEMLNKSLAKLYTEIKSNTINQERLLKLISDIHFINTDITKLEECKKWIQD